MTVTTRMQAPSYQIFNPDALDQIYASKVASDPIMGGIAYTLGAAHKMNKAGTQDQYLASQERFNRMAMALDAMEMQEKRKTKAMEIGGGLVKEGFDPANIPSSAEYLSAPDPMTDLIRSLVRAKTANQLSGGGGGGTKEYDTVQTTRTIPGTQTTETITERRAPGSKTPRTAGPSAGIPATPNAPVPSTPVGPNANAGAVNQEQQRLHATAVVGKDARPIATRPDGAVLWGSPTTGRTIAFTATGKEPR